MQQSLVLKRMMDYDRNYIKGHEYESELLENILFKKNLVELGNKYNLDNKDFECLCKILYKYPNEVDDYDKEKLLIIKKKSGINFDAFLYELTGVYHYITQYQDGSSIVLCDYEKYDIDELSKYEIHIPEKRNKIILEVQQIKKILYFLINYLKNL